MILAPRKPISKVSFFSQIKFCSFWSFTNENHVRHLKTHFFNFKSVIVLDYFLPLAILLDKISPFFLYDKICLVDNEEENENETTGSLDVAKDFDSIDNPILDIKFSVVILSRCIQQICQINNKSNQCWEIFEIH